MALAGNTASITAARQAPSTGGVLSGSLRAVKQLLEIPNPAPFPLRISLAQSRPHSHPGDRHGSFPGFPPAQAAWPLPMTLYHSLPSALQTSAQLWLKITSGRKSKECSRCKSTAKRTKELSSRQGWQVCGWFPAFFIHRVLEGIVLRKVPEVRLFTTCSCF